MRTRARSWATTAHQFDPVREELVHVRRGDVDVAACAQVEVAVVVREYAHDDLRAYAGWIPSAGRFIG